MNKKPIPVDIDKIDLDRLKLQTTDLPGLIEYAHTLGGFSVVPTEQGVIKGRAMQAMQEQTQERMDMILEQMRVLAKQAQEIKDRVQISESIYAANINFQPLMGKRYYLYRRKNGENTLSLIGPKEWGDRPVYAECLAEAQLLSDHTWKIIEKFTKDF